MLIYSFAAFAFAFAFAFARYQLFFRMYLSSHLFVYISALRPRLCSPSDCDMIARENKERGKDGEVDGFKLLVRAPRELHNLRGFLRFLTSRTGDDWLEFISTKLMPSRGFYPSSDLKRSSRNLFSDCFAPTALFDD